MDNKIPDLVSHFSEIADPRLNRQQLHKLSDILVISICAILSGVDTWVHIAEFGRSKLEWFKTFLELKNGIPSHDTFGRVFAILPHAILEEYFVTWVQAAVTMTEGEIIPIDGKRVRGSYDKASGKAAIHMVSAYASASGLVLGQVKTSDKSNEITAIPELLETLYINGCIVTIDAMGCQRAIADKIIEKGADYILALKGNQGKLHDEVIECFDEAEKNNFEGVTHDFHETIEQSHGRHEERRHWLIKDIDQLTQKDKWRGLKNIGMIESKRIVNDEVSTEKRYYICSTAGSAKQFGAGVREHWGIENKVHWVLDVTFNEDQHRAREGNSAHNMSILRRLALNVIKQDKSKGSIKSKRLRAGWNTGFLTDLLGKLFKF